MEYEQNLIPPQLWFCGRSFLKKANELRDQLGDIKSPGPEDIATCEEAKLNILSGIRVALGKPAKCENSNIPFYQELRGRMDDGRLASLMDTIDRELRYKYQINEPCLPKDGESLPVEMLHERLSVVDALFNMAREIFFYDIYVPREGFRLAYKEFVGCLEQDQIVDRVIEWKLAKDPDEALKKYGDAGWIDPLDCRRELSDAFYQYYLESCREDYEDDFWMLDESELQ